MTDRGQVGWSPDYAAPIIDSVSAYAARATFLGAPVSVAAELVLAALLCSRSLDSADMAEWLTCADRLFRAAEAFEEASDWNLDGMLPSKREGSQ